MQINQRKGHATFLLILLFSLLLLQLNAVIQAIKLLLAGAPEVRVLVSLQLVMSLAWAALFASGMIKLWQHRRVWEIRALKLVAGFFMFSGLHFALFVRSDYDRQRIPFVLLTTFLIVFFIIGAIWYRECVRNNGDNE
jgi:hypothetical protein